MLLAMLCLFALLCACQSKTQPTNTTAAETVSLESTSAENDSSSTNESTYAGTTNQETQAFSTTSNVIASTNAVTTTKAQGERTTRPYPDRSNQIVQKNIETIMQEFGFIEPSSFRMAQRLYSIGVEEIVNIEVIVDEENHCEVLMWDSTGEVYYAVISKMFKSVEMLFRGGKDGERIYPVFTPAGFATLTMA